MATIDDFISKLKDQQGKPYVWGGESPSVGFDCSGLIYWALGQFGISYPRTSREIINAARQISVSEALNTKGALLFRSSPSDHIVVSLGNGQIIESPAPGDYVHIVNNYGGWTHGGIIPELTNTPTKPKEGFLMALSDSDQSILFNRVKNILDELTASSGKHLIQEIHTQTKEEGNTMKLAFYKEGNTVKYLAFDPTSGFWNEFHAGEGNGPMNATYIARLATNWNTPWTEVTKVHFAGIKEALERVRTGA